jgi:hypothetical protein
MKVLVYQPIFGWADLKVGCFINERGAVRKVLEFIEEGGEKKVVVSYFVFEGEEGFEITPEHLMARSEFKKPCYKWKLKDFTQFGTKRITFVDNGQA